MSFQKKNQITQLSKFEINKHLIFGEIVDGKVPNSAIEYKRIPIETIYDDGSRGDLIFKLPKDSFSFGVSASSLSGGTQPDSYSFPISLYEKDTVRVDQQQVIDVIQSIIDECKNYIVKKGTQLCSFLFFIGANVKLKHIIIRNLLLI